MTYFSHNTLQRRAGFPAATGSARPGLMRDILWNQPVFKAPVLPIPRIALEPLPFTATRVTQRTARA